MSPLRGVWHEMGIVVTAIILNDLQAVVKIASYLTGSLRTPNAGAEHWKHSQLSRPNNNHIQAP